MEKTNKLDKKHEKDSEGKELYEKAIKLNELPELKLKENRGDKAIVTNLIEDINDNEEPTDENYRNINRLYQKYELGEIYTNKEKLNYTKPGIKPYTGKTPYDNNLTGVERDKNGKLKKPIFKPSTDTEFKKIITIKNKSFKYKDYENKQNYSALKWLIAIRSLITDYRIVGIQYKRTLDGIFDMRNISHDTRVALIDANTYTYMNTFIVDKLFKSEEVFGYQDETGDHHIDVSFIRVYFINSKFENVIGKGLTNKKYPVIKLGKYNCAVINSKDNNCLIDCYKYLSANKLDIDSKDIIKLLKINNKKGIASDNMPILDEYFAIYPTLIKNKDIQYEGNSKILILYEANHYYPIITDIYKISKTKEPKEKKEKKEKKEEEPKEPKEKKEKIERWLYFDYETVWDPITTLLTPYSVYIKLVTSVESESISEPVDLAKSGLHFYGRNCNKEFIRFLIDTHDNRYITYIVGYNSAKFDNFLLLEGLALEHIINKNGLFIANGALLKMKFLSYQTIDLCRFTNNSLKNALKGFKCKVQKEIFSHSDIQRVFIRGGWDRLEKWIEDNKEELTVYNKADVEGLEELYNKVKVEIATIDATILKGFETKEIIINEERIQMNNPRCKLEDYMTISSLCFNLWQKSLSIRGIDIPKGPITANFGKFIRDSLVGGRSQIFQPGIVNEAMQSYDVKSLYPFIMNCNLEYPVGCEIPTKIEVPNKLGVYYVHVIKQPDTKVIPFRTEDKGLDWTYDKPFYRVMTSNCIKVLRDYGGIVEVVPIPINEETVEKYGYDFPPGSVGIYYNDSKTDLFSHYIDPLKKMKTQQDILNVNKDNLYNPALRELLKLMQNGLSGKMGQREFDTGESFCLSTNDELTFLKNHTKVDIALLPNYRATFMSGTRNSYKYDPKNCKPWILMAFIYSYAREHMYRSILNKIDDKYATDTDSVHLKARLKIKSEGRGFGKFNLGGEYGDFEKEIKFKSRANYYVVKKCYALFSENYSDKEMFSLEGDELENYMNRNCKMRFKGVTLRDKLFVICKENYEAIGGVWSIIENLIYGDQKKAILKQFHLCDPVKKFNLYESLTKGLCEELYKTLLDPKCIRKCNKTINSLLTGPSQLDDSHNEVILLSCRLEKKVANSGPISTLASIKNNYILKAIRYNGNMQNIENRLEHQF